MSFKKLLPFLVVLIVLALLGLIKRGSQSQPSIKSQANLEALVSSDLKADAITKVELYAAAAPEEKVVLEKSGDAWVATSQFNAPVTAETIDGYLEKIVKLRGEYRAKASNEDQLGDYDLKDDQAFHVVAYTGGSEPAADLLFGKAPSSSSVFVRRAGDQTVFVESNNLRREAGLFGDDMAEAPKADKWLDKTALKLEKDAITKMAINTPDKALVFEKHEKEVPQPETPEGEEPAEDAPAPEPIIETEWVMTAGGAEKPYKDAALQGVFNRLVNLTASNIVDPAKKAEWGLEPAEFTATITQGEGEQVVIEGGRPDLAGNGYIRIASNDNDVVYELSSYNFDQLFPKGASLVDLPNWEIEKEAITGITIEQPEGRVVLAKQGEEWAVLEPASNLKAQKATIDSLVSAVATWTPGDYADNGVDTGEFNRTVQVAANGSVRSFALAGDAKGSEGAYAKIDGGADVLVMKTADVAKLFVKPRDMFQLALLDIAEEEVTRVDIRMGGETATLRHGENDWTLTIADATYGADAEKASAFVTALLELEASDVNFGASPSSVAESGAFSIVTRDGASRLVTYGAEADAVHPIAVSGMQNTFTVSAPDLDRVLTAVTALKESKGDETAAPAEATTEAPAAAPEAAPEAAPADAPMPAEAPAAEAPAAEAPAAEAPAAEAPAAEAPAAEAPAAEAPAAEAPATEAPAAQ